MVGAQGVEPELAVAPGVNLDALAVFEVDHDDGLVGDDHRVAGAEAFRYPLAEVFLDLDHEGGVGVLGLGLFVLGDDGLRVADGRAHHARGALVGDGVSLVVFGVDRSEVLFDDLPLLLFRVIVLVPGFVGPEYLLAEGVGDGAFLGVFARLLGELFG